MGPVGIGSSHPIRLQTMTTTDTRNVEKTVAQVKLCADRGADLVRITVQGRKEAEASLRIRERLFQDGYDVPLVADIHFQPKVASLVAEAFEKIRVNPGNFVDGRKSFDLKAFDGEDDFRAGRQVIQDALGPLVEKLKRLGRALRIGTNHGSLSARVLSFYGDTPLGMVESAFEFADICRELDYHNFLFSMKASNPSVMVAAYRLLCEKQAERDWDYPVHLGVTEAGEGEDGRIKSAVGIGALLVDGIGDTIRVSLTEDPELEIAPCGTLAGLGERACAEGWGREGAALSARGGLAAAEALPGRGFGDRVGEVVALEAAASADAALPSTPAERLSGWPILAAEHRDTHLFQRREIDLPTQRPTDEGFDYRPLLHRDGTLWLTADPALLREPLALYRAIGARVAVGMPIKDLATVDALVLSSGVPADDREARRTVRRLQDAGIHVVVPADKLREAPMPGAVALVPLADAFDSKAPALVEEGYATSELRDAPAPLPPAEAVTLRVPLPEGTTRYVLTAAGTEDAALLRLAAASRADALLLSPAEGISPTHVGRRLLELLRRSEARLPVILEHSQPRWEAGQRASGFESPHERAERERAGREGARPPSEAETRQRRRDGLIVPAGATLGSLLVDGLGEGALLTAPGEDLEFLRQTGFGLLQGVRMRSTKTDYVSCPSCGRTLFDLQTVTDHIKSATGHLPGVAIAVMGCIVNGPGEMADADFGYVGGAPGLIDLYVGKSLVRRGVPMDKACDELVQLIKEHGRWKDPPQDDLGDAQPEEQGAAGGEEAKAAA